MLNNKQLSRMVNQRFNNNDSKDFILGYVTGLYVANKIDDTHFTDIKKYIKEN